MILGQRLTLCGALLGSLILGWVLISTSTSSSFAQAAPANMPSARSANPQTDRTGQLESQAEYNRDDNAPSQAHGCAVSEKYPAKILRWCELITQYAHKNDLSADLVAALVWQESGGNPQAYSSAGAVGLMQIMPRDGLAASFTCQNGPCFSNRPSTIELKDPEFNLSYGTRMLARLVKNKGNLRDALKSYGPMDVGFYYADQVLGIYQQYGN